MINYEDVIFPGTLLVCIALGNYYKEIPDIEMKKNFGVGLGLLCTILVCGHNFIHSIVMVTGNALILKHCTPQTVHRTSLLFTWSYLTILHTWLLSTKYEIWLHQAMALRLVGLAFEVHLDSNAATNAGNTSTSKSLLNVINQNIKGRSSLSLPTAEPTEMTPTPLDVASYAYFFCGLHKGPYYRWKIFNEHFGLPFGSLGDCRSITERKLKKALLCTLVYILIRNTYPDSVYNEDSFYTEHGPDYRYLYNASQLLAFFLEGQILMLLNTCVFTECGFGMYPANCSSLAGYGPTTNLALIRNAAENVELAKTLDYNFSTIKCFDHRKLLSGPRLTDTLRGWNMPTRYWFWAYTKRTLTKSNKEVRSACGFLMWMIWWGLSLRQIIMCCTLWVYVHLEDECADLYITNGQLERSWNIGYSIMRILCLLYLTPCLFLENMRVLLRYYNSIYWSFHLVILAILVLNIVTYKDTATLPRRRLRDPSNLLLPPNASTRDIPIAGASTSAQ